MMKKIIKIIMTIAVILTIIYLLRQEEINNNPELQKQIKIKKIREKFDKAKNAEEIISNKTVKSIDIATQLVNSRIK